jgi:hypothetical protein
MNPNLTVEEIAQMSNAELLSLALEQVQEHPPATLAEAERVVRLLNFAKAQAAAELRGELGR